MPEQIRKFDAFGHFVPSGDFAQKNGDGLLHQYGLELDKETGNTKIVETGTVDLRELINSYKDQCGMAYARQLLKTGAVSPEAFCDDGRHGADVSVMPDNLNDSYRLALAAKENGDRVAADLGIHEDYMTASDVTKLVQDAVQAALAAKSQEAKEVK